MADQSVVQVQVPSVTVRSGGDRISNIPAWPMPLAGANTPDRRTRGGRGTSWSSGRSEGYVGVECFSLLIVLIPSLVGSWPGDESVP